MQLPQPSHLIQLGSRLASVELARLRVTVVSKGRPSEVHVAQPQQPRQKLGDLPALLLADAEPLLRGKRVAPLLGVTHPGDTRAPRVPQVLERHGRVLLWLVDAPTGTPVLARLGARAVGLGFGRGAAALDLAKRGHHRGWRHVGGGCGAEQLELGAQRLVGEELVEDVEGALAVALRDEARLLEQVRVYAGPGDGPVWRDEQPHELAEA
mmetsp:Transcript_17931/g.36465  ORF Transcript_17931/g.36465 Transcript_17931/m.36465 type:complete len:210 (-) Transcript_17931:731-1360(-)